MDREINITEEWRAVVGWNYEVSCQGRVRNMTTGYILKAQIDYGRCPNTPYLRVMLSNGKRRKNARVHRLVAAAFCHNPHPFTQRHVDHINADSTDNRAVNLEWVTAEENTRRKLANAA